MSTSNGAALTFAERMGVAALDIAAKTGGIAIMAAQIIRRLVPPTVDRYEMVRNLYRMGVKSVPILSATAFFTGAIMVIQAAPVVQQFNAKNFVGWSATFTTFREIGPLLIALMFNGRVGANNTAELGTMVVTEQIDALRVLAIDPIAFLIAPRFVSVVLTLFMMTLFADVLALFGAAYTGQGLLSVSPTTFYNGLTTGLLGFGDVANGLIKSVVFGAMIGLSSCYFGLATKGGAPGVGRAVNASVVASAAGVFVLDYVVSFLLG